VVSFIHVLDLDEGWAHCVGLPKPMWDRPAAAQAMAVSSDGRSAYVVDVGREVVAVMSTSRLETRVEEVELASPGPVRRTSAVTTPDGDTLFVAAAGDGSIITAIDTGSFESRATWRLDRSVSRLGMSLDGSRIYAVTPGAVIVLDPTSGRELGSVAIPATHDPVEDVFALAS
jgi:DNA-binding beta-propeller fold protein YncE